jgi:Ca2+-binding RTX toxin-like protein
MRRKTVFLLAVLLLLIVLFSTFIALTAANTVPTSGLSDTSVQVSASELAPPECDSIRSTLQTVVVCTGGACTGSGANELILGTTGDDFIDGKNGDDCIVGGDGDDALYGDNGNDVLVGGSGTDILDGGSRKKDIDTCIDDPEPASTFIDCENYP